MIKQQELAVDERFNIPFRELRFTFARSGGPGGQNVNKVNSKATLRWSFVSSTSVPPDIKERFAARYRHRISSQGEVLITSQRFRDQGRNMTDCLEKLRALLVAVASPPKRRTPTRPTRGSREARLRQKQERSQAKRLRRGPAFEP